MQTRLICVPESMFDGRKWRTIEIPENEENEENEETDESRD